MCPLTKKHNALVGRSIWACFMHLSQLVAVVIVASTWPTSLLNVNFVSKRILTVPKIAKPKLKKNSQFFERENLDLNRFSRCQFKFKAHNASQSVPKSTTISWTMADHKV